MSNYTEQERKEALHAITSVISRCKKMRSKFAEGTSQHTLLRNRIHAMEISETLIAQESGNSPADAEDVTAEELEAALAPVASIISKCTAAQRKHTEGSPQFIRFQKIITPMRLSEALMKDKLAITKQHEPSR